VNHSTKTLDLQKQLDSYPNITFVI